MLFGSESISTFSKPNITIWMVLALQAGLLNIGGLLACHSFVSHVTGLTTLFGLELYRTHYSVALAIFLVPAFFLTGSMLSGFLVDLPIKLRKPPRYYVIFGIMFTLLLFVVIGGFNKFFGTFGEPLEKTGDYSLLAVLCLVCGIQNGAVTLVSRSVVRTTHLTGITTDLGIGLVRIFNARRLAGLIEGECTANFVRFGTICCFALGSFIGVGVFGRFGFRGFILPAAITGLLFFLTFYFQVLRQGPSRR